MKTYLLSFNLIAFFTWFAYLAYFVLHGFHLDDTSLILLCIAQLTAVFEIFHAFLKWSKSPFVTTFIQVASRLFILVLIYMLFENVAYNQLYKLGVLLVSIAWSITELVRYSYYFFSLLGKNIAWLTWSRYTLFLMLYPMGGTGEMFIGISQLQQYEFAITLFNALTFVVLLSYVYFFPKLYQYMLSQRSKKLV